MMSSSGHLISGLDVAAGTFVLMVFSAGAALAVLVVLANVLFRRAGQSGMAGPLWVCALAMVGGMLGYALLDRSAVRDQAAERRVIEARAAELTARSLAPGSALACLDAVASVVVENACEKPLFANPEAVAAAVAYIDARFSLLAPSIALAERDPSYQPSLERLRRGLEADRFGLVAHVLTTRGCNGADCAELRLLHDPTRVVANMKAHAFDASLGVHALAWQPGGAGMAAVASVPPSSIGAPSQPLMTTGIGGAVTASPGGAPMASSGPPGSSKFDFPSAASIPAVSIMSAEPGAAPAPEPRPATVLPPKRPAAASTPRRQNAREAAAPPAPPPQRAAQPAPQPPTQIAPEAPPPPLAVPDQHSSR
jgi:hypothetical protein